MKAPSWVFDDGGRAATGFAVGHDAGDCVARAIAIAAEIDYREAYDLLAGQAAALGGRRSARDGVKRKVYDAVFSGLGFAWTATMHIGQGCTVHLRADELPSGRLVARLSGHLVAVVDGVVRDTDDATRDGTRCVYGYWQRP